MSRKYKKNLFLFFFFTYFGVTTYQIIASSKKKGTNKQVTKTSLFPQKKLMTLTSLVFLKKIFSIKEQKKINFKQLKYLMAPACQTALQLQKAYPNNQLIDFIQILHIEQDINNYGVELTQACASPQLIEEKLLTRSLLHKKDDFFLFQSQKKSCLLYYQAEKKIYYLFFFEGEVSQKESTSTTTKPKITYYKNIKLLVSHIFKALSDQDQPVRINCLIIKKT